MLILSLNKLISHSLASEDDSLFNDEQQVFGCFTSRLYLNIFVLIVIAGLVLRYQESTQYKCSKSQPKSLFRDFHTLNLS